MFHQEIDPNRIKEIGSTVTQVFTGCKKLQICTIITINSNGEIINNTDHTNT